MTMLACSSRHAAFTSGSAVTTRRVRQTLGGRGVAGATMMKKGIHPEWYPEAKVICNGSEVMTVGGTKPVYNVDVYSGNHPFYQGVRTVLIADDGQLNKFKSRFADLGALSEIGAAAGIAGKAVDEDAPKKAGGKKKK